jgi:hypothetical protein
MTNLPVSRHVFNWGVIAQISIKTMSSRKPFKRICKHVFLLTLSIHPRYKHDVAYRLYLGALGVAYHQRDVEFEGPFPTSAVVDSTHRHLTIEYGRGLAPIEVRSSTGFEVYNSILFQEL